MKLQTQYLIYKQLKPFNKIMQEWKVLRISLGVIQAICIKILLLLNIQDQLGSCLLLAKNSFQMLNSYILTPQIAEIISITSLALIIFLIALIIIKIKLLNNFIIIAKNNKILKFIDTIKIGAWYLIQCSAIIIFWSFSEIYYKQGLFYFVTRSSIFIIAYSWYNLKFKTGSLYQFFTPIFIFSITISSNILFYILALIISGYIFLRKSRYVDKTAISNIVFLMIFVLKNAKFDTLSLQSAKTSFFILMTALIINSVLIYKLRAKLTIDINKKSHEQNCFLILNQLKNQIPYSEMKYSKFLYLYEQVISFVIKQKNQQRTDQIMNKNPSQVSVNQLYTVLKSHLQLNQKRNAPGEDLIMKKMLLLKTKLNQNHELSNILNVFYLILRETQGQSKFNKQQIFQIYEKLISKFAKYKNDCLFVEYIQKGNQIHEKIEEKYAQLIESVDLFWSAMTNQDYVSQTNINENLERIVKMRNELETLNQFILNIQLFNKQSDKIRQIRNMVNSYENQRMITSKEYPKQLHQEQNQQNLTYFITLEDNKIEKISQNLLKSLGFQIKTKSNFFNMDLKHLVGEEFSEYIQNKVNSLKGQSNYDQNQKLDQDFLLPICCKNGLVQLRTISILWYPSMDSYCKYLISFSQNSQFNRIPFLLYNQHNDEIKYFSQVFFKYFDIETSKFTNGSKVIYQTFFNQIFSNIRLQGVQLKNFLNEEKSFNCKINLSKLKQFTKICIYDVEIKAVKCLKIEENHQYIVLRVLKSENKKYSVYKTSSALTQSDAVGSTKLRNQKQLSLGKRYENERFFCPIQNPYLEKINEKLTQIQDKKKWRAKEIIHALMGILVISLISLVIVSHILTEQRLQKYKQYNVELQNISQQYALIYQGYSLALKKYYMSAYPMQTLLVKKTPAFVIIGIYRRLQQSFITQFLHRYLNQLQNDVTIPKIQYNIKFDYFEVQTDTYKTTLIDFIQHLKQNIVSGEIQFLLQNYDSFRKLTLKYEQLMQFDNGTNSIVSQMQSIECFFASLYCVLVVLTILTIRKIESSISSVYSTLSIINQIQYSKILLDFKSKFTTYKSKRIMSKQTIQTKNSILSIKQNKKEKQSKDYVQNTFPSLTQNQFPNRKGDKIIDTFSNQDGFAKMAASQAVITENASIIIAESFVRKILRFSFFIFLVICLFAVCFIDYSALALQQTGMDQIFDIKKQLYSTLLQVKRQEVDTAIKPIAQEYFKANTSFKVIDYKNNSLISLISQVHDNLIIQEMNYFTQKSYQDLSGNLCSLPATYAGNIIPCQYYLNGLITKGFGQLFDKYKQYGKMVSNLKLSEFGLTPCGKTSCPPAFEHEYVSIKLGQTARYVLGLFNQEINKVYARLTKEDGNNILVKTLIIVLIALCYLVWNYYYEKRCVRALMYFKMIPKEVISKGKITSYIKKNNILNNLCWI